MPTISFNQLASLTSLREAPNGSIKPAEPGEGKMFHPSSTQTSGPSRPESVLAHTFRVARYSRGTGCGDLHPTGKMYE